MDAVYRFDFSVLEALQGIHSPVLDVIMKFFTYAGNGAIIWAAAAVILLCIKRTRHIGNGLFIAMALDGIINELIIKNLVQRDRPFVQNPLVDTIVGQPSSYSFPSGHTCTAFASATVIFFFNKRWGIVAYVTAALIGFSRNYFYIHFPTDVLCGALEGLILGTAAVLILTRFFIKRVEDEPAPEAESTEAPEDLS